MEITSMTFLIDEKRAALEKKLKASEKIDDFEIEELDKNDSRKEVTVAFKEPINARFISDVLKSIFGQIGGKKVSVEE